MAELKRAGIGCPYCGQDLYVDFDICPHCGKDIPESLLQLIRGMHGNTDKNTDTDSLPHFEDLEEDSKTKIGTFERLYEEYKSKPKSYGFDDTDYAPLVMLLSSVLEIELLCAVCNKFLTYWRKFDKEVYDDPERTCTIGKMKFLLEQAEKNNGYSMPKNLKPMWHYAQELLGDNLNILHDFLQRILNTRNNAAHKQAISKREFQEFFTKYSDFYKQYIPAVLKLKKHGDSHGYRLFMDMRKDFPNL